jgi:hypothetical protein
MAGLVTPSTMLDRLARAVASSTDGSVVFVAVNARVGLAPPAPRALGSALPPPP